MKVLFYVRANHQEVRGGDLVQLYSTGAALEGQGVEIDYKSDPKLDLKKYDIVHIFNSPRFGETKKFFQNAQKQSKPIAFSTIYWSKDELAIGVAKSKKVQLSSKIFGVPVTKFLWRNLKKVQNMGKTDSNNEIEKWLFENADILLPNSDGEMREIERIYKVKNRAYVPVRNAINTTMFKKAPSSSRQDFVLSVGRIERRKNSLKLIEACHNLGFKLTLIGGLDSEDDYGLQCQQKIQEYGFTHIPNIEQKDLIPYYYKAKVHAIVSWYETPGLSTMEAACGGCNIVSTDRGSTTEYFGNLVNYCDPFSQTSIEQAIKNAMSKKTSLGLRIKITSQYTWDGAATDTLKGYNKLV